MLRVTKKFLDILDKRQKRLVVLFGFLMFVGGILESIGVSLILPLVTAVVEKDDWNIAWYAKMICDLFDVTEQTAYIKILIILLIIVFLGKNVFLLLQYYAQYTFIARSRYKMQRSMMIKFINKPYTYYLKANSGEIIRILSEDIPNSFTVLIWLMQFYTEGFIALLLGLTILVISPVIALSLGGVLLVELLVIAKVLKPILQKHGDKSRFYTAIANKWILQSIQGIKAIKVSQTEDYFCKKYSDNAERVVHSWKINQALSNLPRIIIEAVTICAALILLFIMVSLGYDLTMLLPQISAFALAAVRLLPSISRISSAMNSILFFEGGLDNMVALKNAEDFEAESDMKDRNAVMKEKEEVITFEQKLEVRELIFSYPEDTNRILDCAGMKIEAGQSVGIVGASGGGKTTTVDIILGLLKPQSGYICADGKDISKNISSWRSHLGYIPQRIFLMDDTIRENVIFGKSDEDREDKIWEALREAQMEEFVRGLPEGLDTIVGEQGVRLSGGQQQRIGIARALYNNPDILFFDEATSALDNETENAIMESINKLKGRKTLVIIAHRLSTIESCDVVYRVQNGKIVKEERQ